MIIPPKGIYAIIAVLTYSLLIAFYFKLPKDIFTESDEDKKCNNQSPCVRFCLSRVKNRTNAELFKHFNETFLSQLPYDGFNNTIDLENSDDETVIAEVTTKKPSKSDVKKEGIDYGTGDYSYADFGKEQKMKGKKTKREVDGDDDFDDFDDDEEEIESEINSVTKISELEEETTTLGVEYSTFDNNNETEVVEKEEQMIKVRKIKIYRQQPDCIDKDDIQKLSDMRYNLVK